MKYLILSSPRTGSTMLAAALNATGRAGLAKEYFHERLLAENGQPEQDKDRMLGYFTDVVTAGTTANGVFGMKLHYNQFDHVFSEKRLGLRSGASFVRSFDKHILIHRRDKILQAISELLAGEKHLWNSAESKVAGSVGRDFAPGDVPLLARIMGRQLSEEYAWRRLLGDLSIAYHEVAYEDLAAAPDMALGAVAAYLGIEDLGPVTAARDTVKLTDTRATEAIKAKFLEALGVR